MQAKRLCVWAAVACGLAGGAAGCVHRHGPVAPGVLGEAAVGVLADVLENTPRPVTDPTLTEAERAEALSAQYQLHNQALQVLAEFPAIVQPHWLGRALDSPSAAVRYAALLTVGRLAGYEQGRLSRPFVGRVRELAADANVFVQMAASYALRELGDDRMIGRFVSGPGQAGYLDNADPAVRAEAAYILSLMADVKGTDELLKSRLKDPAETVGVVVLTRLAVMGYKPALNEVINMAQAPRADDRLDALEALGQVPADDLGPIRRAFNEDIQQEVRMAAARALGRHGDPAGLKLALKWLAFEDTREPGSAEARRDPLREYRVRILAALALGGIGDYDASAGPLLKVMQTSPSKRFRLAAARAALELLHPESVRVAGAANTGTAENRKRPE